MLKKCKFWIIEMDDILECRQIYILKQKQKPEIFAQILHQIYFHLQKWLNQLVLFFQRFFSLFYNEKYQMPFQSYLSHLICFISVYRQAAFLVILSITSESYLISLIILIIKEKINVTVLTCFMFKYLNNPILTNHKTGADDGVMFTSLLFQTRS